MLSATIGLNTRHLGICVETPIDMWIVFVLNHISRCRLETETMKTMKKQAIKTLMKKPAREPICSQPDDADTGDNRPFAVEANVNLYGTAIMLVHASNETAATKLAEEELEHAEFTILA